MGSFLSKWYYEGVLLVPPPCLYSETFRRYFSDNTCGGPISCVRVGRWGTNWGERNRSPIMFFAFWASIISFILLSVSFTSQSYSPEHVRHTAWTTGKVLNADPTDLGMRFYVGLRILVVDCDGSNCPIIEASGNRTTGEGTQTLVWDEDECSDDFAGDSCESCRESADGTVSTAVLSLVGVIPQLLVNLQRSVAAGDLNCQKWVGIWGSLFGFLTTLAALVSYRSGCFKNLPSHVNGYEMEYHLGPAFHCMLWATLLKPVDALCNFLVPVPLQGGWDPSRNSNKYTDAKVVPVGAIEFESQLSLGKTEVEKVIHNDADCKEYSHNKDTVVNADAESQGDVNVTSTANTCGQGNTVLKVAPVTDVDGSVPNCSSSSIPEQDLV